MIERLGTAIWTDLPSAIGARLPSIGAVLADGRYLLGIPVLALVAPIGAFVVGVAVGAGRPISDQLFTFSVAWPAVLLAVGALGAGLGFWAWLGFALGDFFLYRHVFFEMDPVTHLVKERLPLLILYEVLFALVVLSPIAVRTLPSPLVRAARQAGLGRMPAWLAEISLAAFVAALTAASWSASAGILVRPLATFHDGVLGPQAVQPLRQLGSVLIAVAVAGAVGRHLAEAAVGRSGKPVPPTAAPRGGRRSVLGTVAMAIVGSLLITLGLAGILDGPSALPVLFVIVLTSAVARTIVLPRVPAYARLVGRVPALVRIVAMGGVGYAVGSLVASWMVPDGYLQASWQPVLVSVAISIAVATFLFPAPPASPPGVAVAPPRAAALEGH